MPTAGFAKHPPVPLPTTTLARLFQPFAQADTTLDRSKGGLGLGLALVKGLVELHGGTISAHGAGVGQGAEFVVRLPLALQDVPTAGLVHSRVERSNPVVSQKASLRFLHEIAKMSSLEQQA